MNARRPVTQNSFGARLGDLPDWKMCGRRWGDQLVGRQYNTARASRPTSHYFSKSSRATLRQMGAPDELHASSLCCGTCEHAAAVASGKVVDVASHPLAVQFEEGHPVGAVLVARTGSGVLRFSLTRTLMTIGRGKDNDIVISNDHALSRVTCELSLSTEGIFVRDLNSSCGTWVGTQKVGSEPVRMRTNDEIIVGRSRLSIELSRG